MTNGQTSQQTADGQTDDWESLFPYAKPYPAQKSAINEAIDVLKDNGFTVAEMACGTGKTLTSLMAGLTVVRDPSTRFERVFALTSVNQQLRAFEDDVKRINNNLDTTTPEVTGLTLIKKAEMCSYVEGGVLSHDRIYSDCESLRKPVREAIGNENNPQAAQRALKSMIDDVSVGSLTNVDTALESDTWMAPYQDELPEGSVEDSFCGFYANYRLKKMREEDVLEFNGMMTPENVMKQASENGVCPHAALGATLEDAEVVIGNYKHAFDPVTIQAFTQALIDDSTLVVCDEAHTLVANVRDELSDEMTLRTVEQSVNEIEREVRNQDAPEVQQILQEEMNGRGITPDDIQDFSRFLQQFVDEIKRISITALEEQTENWQEKAADFVESSNADPIEYGLRNPKTTSQDELSVWISENDFEDAIENAEDIGDAIGDALKRAEDEVGYTVMDTYTDTVGRVLSQWWERDHEEYFREIVIDPRDRRNEGAELYWREFFEPTLKLLNCIPSKEIAHRLDDFGGGILMSATLYPLDTYQKIVGLEPLEQFKNRPVKEIVHGLPFPEQNRQSLAVDATKFTNNNRGARTDTNETRREYRSVITDAVKQTDGNVLICMPSYYEAEWVEYFLDRDNSVYKDVKADESSSNSETEALKSWFFSGGGKVLVTSLRGTLTEGVDYDGDKLEACIVCGVPIQSLGGPYPDAIRNAYESRFGNDGFEFAFSIPAIRKARQALGRVIRGEDEVGVRVLVDERYTDEDRWDSARAHFPEYEQRDYRSVKPVDVGPSVKQFWEEHQT